MKHIQLIETILYVNEQKASDNFYTKLFRQNTNLNVPGMTEFKLAENRKLDLMPNKGIVKKLSDTTPHHTTPHHTQTKETKYQDANFTFMLKTSNSNLTTQQKLEQN